MEKYLAALLLSVSSFAYAQESTTIPIPAQCVDMKTLESVLDKFNELPVLRGNSTRNTPNGPAANSLVIFVNMELKTWTLVEKLPSGKYCILAVGGEFEPVPEEIRNNLQKKRQAGKV